MTYTKHEDAAQALKAMGPRLKNCVGKRFSEAVVRWAKASQKPPKTVKGRTKSSARVSGEDFKDTWKFVKRRIGVVLTNAHTMFSNEAEIMEDPKQDPVIAPPMVRMTLFPGPTFPFENRMDSEVPKDPNVYRLPELTPDSLTLGVLCALEPPPCNNPLNHAFTGKRAGICICDNTLTRHIRTL